MSELLGPPNLPKGDVTITSTGEVVFTPKPSTTIALLHVEQMDSEGAWTSGGDDPDVFCGDTEVGEG